MSLESEWTMMIQESLMPEKNKGIDHEEPLVLIIVMTVVGLDSFKVLETHFPFFTTPTIQQ